MTQPFDLMAMGRVSMDLFSEQIGAAFEDVESFSTSVGGSPSNVAIGTSRLGLSSALITGVGQDKVGDFVLNYLNKEKVATDYIYRKEGRTGLAVVGVQPPSSFPLTFYRENPADINLSIDDVLNIPFENTRAFLVSGTGLARGARRDATFVAAERAKQAGTTIFMDFDLRPDQWHDPKAYGVNVRAILPLVDVVIATEEETYAALLENANDSNSTVIRDLKEAEIAKLEQHLSQKLQEANFPSVWVLKRGAKGVSIFTKDAETVNASGFNVEVINTVGAGDAFASGFIYSYLQGSHPKESATFANACGAIVVSRHGCSAAMPSLSEVTSFLKKQSATMKS